MAEAIVVVLAFVGVTLMVLGLMIDLIEDEDDAADEA